MAAMYVAALLTDAYVFTLLGFCSLTKLYHKEILCPRNLSMDQLILTVMFTLVNRK